MASIGRPAWQIASALVIGLVVAGAPAAYFYSQNSTLQSKQATLNSQVSYLQSSEASLEANITALTTQRTELEANITALNTQKAGLSANVTDSEQRIQQLDSQITTLQSQLSSDEATISQLNQELASFAAYGGYTHINKLGSWRVTASGPCFAVYAGPFTVLNDGGINFASYLKLVVNGTGQASDNVTWDANGINYSGTAVGNASFPLLPPATNLNITTEVCGTADVTVTAYQYS